MAGWKCPRCGVAQCSCQEKTASDGTKGCSACTPGYENKLQAKKLNQLLNPLPPVDEDEKAKAEQNVKPAGVVVHKISFRK